jgi:GNAT superfamily N-acetyltransferase
VIDRLRLPTTVLAGTATVSVRRATADDLPSIVRLLTDDPISAARGDTGPDRDTTGLPEAFHRIAADPGNDLVVVVDGSDTVVGTLQLTAIPGLARGGSTRLLVEAVRVGSTERSAGIGSALMRWVTERAAVDVGAALVQLTSDATRVDAHRFYRRLGFVDSHLGFKYAVEQRSTGAP